MSIFDLSVEFPIEETDLPTPDEIREQVSMAQVVSHLAKLDGTGKTPCLWHVDKKTPNLHIYVDHGFCFVCSKKVDALDYVQQKLGISFVEALRWFSDNMGVLPEPEITRLCHTTSYKGPVPENWINGWYMALSQEHREMLGKTRLLNGVTIGTNKIGWRPDYAAYTIPFWSGVPQLSDVEIVQFRSTDKSPQFYGKDWKYRGQRGYNKTSVINRHLVNEHVVVVLFGTFDALLAAQDGIPAISANGSTQFTDQGKAESLWLKQLLSGTKTILIVPDKTPEEHLPAQMLANMLGGQVRYFPMDMEGKDYTDWRLSGRTAADFVKEVLKMDFAQRDDGFTYIVEEEQLSQVDDLLVKVAQGQGQAAFEVLKALAAYFEYEIQSKNTFSVINYTMQQRCLQRLDPTFTMAEWVEICGEIANSTGFQQLCGVLLRWSDVANSRFGGF